MSYKILLVEDNLHKRDKVLSAIDEIIEGVFVSEAGSFTSGWRSLSSMDFDIAILDMSLPTFDVGEGESGGKFRTFGGKELSRKMNRRKLRTKYLFVTQYQSFNDINGTQSLESLEEEVEKEALCLGVIHFDTTRVEWKDKLLSILRTEIGG